VLPPRSRVCLTPDGPVTRRPVLPLCQLRVRLGDTKRQTSDLVRSRQRPPKIRLTLRQALTAGMAIFTADDETRFTRSARTVSNPTDRPASTAPPWRRSRAVHAMPMRHATELTRIPVAPPCFLCQSPDRVRLLVREWTAEGIQYWACDGCDVAWAMRDGEDVKSMAGDRSSRRSL
jgi:hypothetical protein